MCPWDEQLVDCLFVSKIRQKTIQPIFTKFGGKVTHGPRERPLDQTGSRYVRVSVMVRRSTAVLRMGRYVLFTSNNFATSAAFLVRFDSRT